MFGDVWEWAGAYRKSITSIGIKPGFISTQLAEFCHEVLSWMQHPVDFTIVEMAAKIHHRLVFIHPFENGNGRFSRLIADRFLLAWRCPYPMWPNYLNRESMVRQDYIQTLKSADKGNYAPLIDFIKKFGAREPKLSELLKNDFYRFNMNIDSKSAIVKALLRSGGNPNDETSSGHRSLQLAIKSGSKEIVKLLIAAGADQTAEKEQ